MERSNDDGPADLRTRNDGSREGASREGASPQAASGGGSPDEEIRRRAYEIFQARGGASGNEMDDWLTAEREVRQRRELRQSSEMRERRPEPGPAAGRAGEMRADEMRTGEMRAGAADGATEPRSAMSGPPAGEEGGATSRRGPQTRQDRSGRVQ